MAAEKYANQYHIDSVTQLCRDMYVYCLVGPFSSCVLKYQIESRVHQIFKGQLSSLSLGVKCSYGGSLFVSKIFLKYIFV